MSFLIHSRWKRFYDKLPQTNTPHLKKRRDIVIVTAVAFVIFLVTVHGYYYQRNLVNLIVLRKIEERQEAEVKQLGINIAETEENLMNEARLIREVDKMGNVYVQQDLMKMLWKNALRKQQ